MKQYTCNYCGKLFTYPHLELENRGEFWGMPAFEEMSYSPCCKESFTETRLFMDAVSKGNVPSTEIKQFVYENLSELTASEISEIHTAYEKRLTSEKSRCKEAVRDSFGQYGSDMIYTDKSAMKMFGFELFWLLREHKVLYVVGHEDKLYGSPFYHIDASAIERI